jgi:MIP family channel proteins
MVRRPRVASAPAGSRTGPALSSGLLAPAAAEVIGTFLLVFMGPGSLLALRNVDTPLKLIAVGLAHGFALLIAVYALGHVSGAHINPAVTIGLAVARRFPWAAVPAYLIAQFVGGILASLALWGFYGNAARRVPNLLGATVPGSSSVTAMFTEAVLTFLLVAVVMSMVTDKRANLAGAGLAIGLTLAVGIFAAGPISGGSFNPVRSLAPMIVSLQFPGWWAYIVGPIVGGALGALVYDRLLRPGVTPTP